MTGSKLGKEYIKAVYCHPAYLTYMQSTSYVRFRVRQVNSVSWDDFSPEVEGPPLPTGSLLTAEGSLS